MWNIPRQPSLKVAATNGLALPLGISWDSEYQPIFLTEYGLDVATTPRKSPPELYALLGRNAVTLSDASFSRDATGLMDVLKAWRGILNRNSEPGPATP